MIKDTYHHRAATRKNSVKMTERAAQFYYFMQKYLQDSTKPASVAPGNVTMPNVIDLQSAARSVNIYPESLAFCDENDYREWAIQLKLIHHWSERRPLNLWTALKQARQAWCRRNEQQGSKAKVAHDQPSQTEPRRNSNMTKAYSAFSDVFVEDFSEIDTDIDTDTESLSDNETTTSRMCDFCCKETVLYDRPAEILKRLTGDRGFFCAFCVSNGFHTKRRKNVLILSLRGLIGYMYHLCYFGKTPRLYLSQLQDLIAGHVLIGKTNPLFIYDPETYCWFVDFAAVGNTPRKVPAKEVILTVNEMITAFNPYDNIKDFKSHLFTERFKEAILDWYAQRQRPTGKIVLAPTLKGCACDTREIKKTEYQTTQQKVDLSALRDFHPPSLRIHSRR